MSEKLTSGEMTIPWPRITLTEVSARYAFHPLLPPRVRVEDSERDWQSPAPTYKPVYVVRLDVLANSKHPSAQHVENQRWADTEEITPAMQIEIDRRCHFYHPNASPTINGRRKHPYGRLGLEGRGVLGKHGPNPAADAMLTRETSRNGKNIIQVLLVRREDGVWAIPGVILHDTEEPENAAARALSEKMGIGLDISETYLAYRGIAGDHRDTDDAWIVTSFYHRHLSEDDAEQLSPKEGQRSIDAAWVDIDDPRIFTLHADHTKFVAQALTREKLPSFEVGAWRVTERERPLHLVDQVFLAGPATPSIDWRAEYRNMLGALGVHYIDPTEAGKDWVAETHIPVEVKGIAESRIDAVNINSLKGAYISLIEAGAAAVGSILRNGQECGIYFENMTEEYAMQKFGETGAKVVLRTRRLVHARLFEAQNNLPNIRVFAEGQEYIGENGDTIPAQGAFNAWLRSAALRMRENPYLTEGDLYAVLSPERPLIERVVVFGSSGEPWHERAQVALQAADVDFYDTLIKGRSFEQEDIEREQIEKNNCAVALLVIDNEPTPEGRLGGEGALAEMCWQFLHAARTGQKLIISIEQTKDPTAHSLRLAAKLHIEELIREFPGVAVLETSVDKAIMRAAAEMRAIKGRKK